MVLRQMKELGMLTKEGIKFYEGISSGLLQNKNETKNKKTNN